MINTPEMPRKQEVVSATGGMKERTGKDDWSLMQPLWPCLAFVVKVLMFGVSKYARGNWVNVPAQEFEAAAMRHWVAYQGGEWLASDSKIPHLSHMICNLLFIHWIKMKEGQQ